ncbi:MAG: methyltransferase domain-containing protein [Candidatus Tumulicola sp.]
MDILVIGEARDDLLGLLDAQGCTMTCVLVDGEAVEEAQVICSEALAPNAVELPASLGKSTFDVVLFDHALERLHEPWRLLAASRRVLREGGYAIAMITNRAHGAIRLALLKGVSVSPEFGVPSYFRGFTSRIMNDLFQRAEFSLECVEHVRQPIFGSQGVLPNLERTNFPRAVVDEIEADSLSDVYQFVVKAVPSGMTADQPGLGNGNHTPSEASARSHFDIAQPVSIVGPERREDTIDPALLKLQRELEAEQAVRRELLAALEEAGASAAAFEQRLHEMTSQRTHLEAARDQVAAFQVSQLEKLQTQVADYEKGWSALYLELEDVRTQAAQLKVEAGPRESELAKQAAEAAENRRALEEALASLEEIVVQLADERQRTVEIEDARLRATSQMTMLQGELEAERDRVQSVVQQFESARQQAEIQTSCADEAERKANALQVQVDQGAEYVADLLEQLAKKDWQISEDAERVNQLECECTEFREQLADERQRTVEIEDARLQVTSQLTMLQGELEAERDRVRRVVQQLESARQQAEIQTSCTDEAEQRANALQVQVDQGTEYAADLLEQLAKKDRQISEDTERVVQLERECSEFREQQLADERQRTVEIEDARLRATSQLTMLQGELEAERDRVQRVVQQLENARQQAEIQTSYAGEAEQKANALQVQVDQGAEYAADLLEQLAMKDRQISEDAERVDQLVCECAELREQHLAEIKAAELRDAPQQGEDEISKRAKRSEANLGSSIRQDKPSRNKPESDRSLKDSAPASTRLKDEMDRLKRARTELDDTLGRAPSRTKRVEGAAADLSTRTERTG